MPSAAYLLPSYSVASYHAAERRLNRRRDYSLLPQEEVLPMVYKSRAKVIPLEISLEQVTQYV